MSQIVHEFIIRRKDSEYELRASFEVSVGASQRTRRGKRNSNIEISEGRAELIGEVFLVGEDIPWTGRLSPKEREQVEEDVYESYMESNEPNSSNRPCDDSCLIDCEFDDGFDIDMAIKVSGRGSVSW
jgi:hypothetical protein